MASHQGAVQVTRTEPALTHAALAEGADPAVRRILIVDDEPNIRSFIGRALAAAGYLTGFADSGSEGLRHALDEHYDLVILDLVMPDMDGCSVLDQLLRARPDQTVMVLSCVADVATKVDCLERGARDYLTKPFSLAELLVRIRVRLREDAHLRGEARAGEAAGEIIRAGNLTLDVARLVAGIGPGPAQLAVPAGPAGRRVGGILGRQPGRDLRVRGLGDHPLPLHLDQLHAGVRVPHLGTPAHAGGARRGHGDHRRGHRRGRGTRQPVG